MPLLGHLVVADVAVVAPDALVAAGAERLGRPAPVRMITPTVVVVAGPVERVGQLEQGLRAGRRCAPRAGRS